jgi:hypothetical protein
MFLFANVIDIRYIEQPSGLGQTPVMITSPPAPRPGRR